MSTVFASTTPTRSSTIIQTNIQLYPVSFKIPQTTKNVLINDVNTFFDSVTQDVFNVITLNQGLNNIQVKVTDFNGAQYIFTKQVNYDPNYSTQDSELIYANIEYLISGVTLKYAILVIDTRQNDLIGVINKNTIAGMKTIVGISKDGSELFLYDGTRYSTITNQPNGKTIPNYYGQRLVFSNDGHYVFYGNNKLNIQTNEVINNSVSGSPYCISGNDSRLFVNNGYLETATNTLVNKGSNPWGTDFCVGDYSGSNLFVSSFAWASGSTKIYRVSDLSILAEYTSLGDYAGDVIAAPNGTVYAGFFGNTWYGKGGILILDGNTFAKKNYFSLPGARSITFGKNGKIYASSVYSIQSGHVEGDLITRGIVELVPIDNGTNLRVNRVFFADLLSRIDNPYYSDNSIFFKPGLDASACYSNTDCGVDGFVDQEFCQSNQVYQNYKIFTCNNPGEYNATCSNTTQAKLKRECMFGCSLGKCNSKPQSTGPVAVIGRKLFVDGNQFTVKAVGYAPTPIGNSPDYGYDVTIHSDLRARDFPLIRAMNANSIRTWGKVNSASFLTDAWNNGVSPIRIIMGYWMGPEKDYQNVVTRQAILTDFNNYVKLYKNYPAVLVWAIGNEENYFYGSSSSQKHAAYFSLVNEMAKNAYLIEGDSYHPVVAVSLEMPGQFNSVGSSVGGSDDQSIPFVDIWGLNNYPGLTFGDWFNLFSTKTEKPLLITEYGIDAFDNNSKTEYEITQANWIKAEWREIEASAYTIGGSLMEYCDEWWKSGGASQQDNGGYPTTTHPDGYANEEWWGVVRIGINPTGGIDLMTPRQAYYMLQQEFSRGPIKCYKNSDCGADSSTKICQNGNVYQNVLAYTCVNPGTIDAICSHNENFNLFENCGNNLVGDWSAPVCNGNKLESTRIITSRGCFVGACYSTPTIEINGIDCSLGCLNGECKKELVNLTINSVSNLKLVKGWNLVGFPIVGTISVSEVQSDCNIMSYVWEWDATRTQYKLASLMQSGRSYWLYALNDCNFNFGAKKELATGVTLELLPGWNFVSGIDGNVLSKLPKMSGYAWAWNSGSSVYVTTNNAIASTGLVIYWNANPLRGSTTRGTSLPLTESTDTVEESASVVEETAVDTNSVSVEVGADVNSQLVETVVDSNVSNVDLNNSVVYVNSSVDSNVVVLESVSDSNLANSVVGNISDLNVVNSVFDNVVSDVQVGSISVGVVSLVCPSDSIGSGFSFVWDSSVSVSDLRSVQLLIGAASDFVRT
ncbi:MAG: glycoside hydrolase family 2 TIM barrel-domain containing protein, partial [archaeon]